MSLSKVLEEIKKLKPIAEENTEAGAPETLNARRGRKNHAIEQLKDLKRQYIQEMTDSALFVIVSGQQREAFATLATETFEKFGFFSSNPEEFYEELSSRVSPALYLGKETNSNVLEVVGRHLEDKAMEIGISSYPQLIFKQHHRRVIDSKAQFTAVVRQAINEQVGPEIVGINAIHSLADVAISKNHTDMITPIILPTGDEQLAVELLNNLRRVSPRTFLVVAGKASKTLKSMDSTLVTKEVTEETVKSTLAEIKKSLKR